MRGVLQQNVLLGADISEKMINYARKNYADKRLSYIVMDIESDLPSDQIECYENITSFYCLHWCQDIRYFSIFFVGCDNSFANRGLKSLLSWKKSHIKIMCYRC